MSVLAASQERGARPKHSPTSKHLSTSTRHAHVFEKYDNLLLLVQGVEGVVGWQQEAGTWSKPWASLASASQLPRLARAGSFDLIPILKRRSTQAGLICQNLGPADFPA